MSTEHHPDLLQFESRLRAVGRQMIVIVPQSVSRQLPSRGQVAVRVVMRAHEMSTVLEPDGDGGHWLRIHPQWQEQTGCACGDLVHIGIRVERPWPEPIVPDDFGVALAETSPEVFRHWQSLSSQARWEWVRWIESTKVAKTRTRRILVSISKLSAKKRRPCCFNLAACTDSALCRNGKLALDLD